MCLVRQSLEALTVAEIGLQKRAFGEPLLDAWKTGKKSQGELRNALERDIWASYGTGLWDEPWANSTEISLVPFNLPKSFRAGNL